MRTLTISAFFVLVTDQISKFIIKKVFYLHQSLEIIKDIFYITYVQNTGISFGMLGGVENELKRWILVALIGTAIIIISYYWFSNRNPDFIYNLGSGMILGGALGNFIDRLFTGKVVDFIEIGYKNFRWPVFNLADTFISIGIVLLIFYFVFVRKLSE